ncbi:MAG: hypothetical protein J0L92_36675 [Deltaproteobacteria bacterium]|nr:hypothetical protein [Deltaproteobacteria bacterium]
MGDAYRDDREGLRARLIEAERAAAIAEAHARAEPRVDHGRSISECHTRVICEETVHEGLAACGDREHLTDPGRLEVNLVTGQMTVDGERYRL